MSPRSRFVALVITVVIGLIANVRLSATTVAVGPAEAQEHSFAHIADLVTRKGGKGVAVSQLCQQLGIAGESRDGTAIQFAWEDDEDKRHHLFNIFQGISGKQRILLIKHNMKMADAFLTGPAAILEAVAKGVKKSDGWQWTRTAKTPELSSLFQKEVAYWKSIEGEVAKEPDRKD